MYSKLYTYILSFFFVKWGHKDLFYFLDPEQKLYKLNIKQSLVYIRIMSEYLSTPSHLTLIEFRGVPNINLLLLSSVKSHHKNVKRYAKQLGELAHRWRFFMTSKIAYLVFFMLLACNLHRLSGVAVSLNRCGSLKCRWK